MYCKYCGNKLTSNSKYCNKCGKAKEENATTTDTGEVGKGRAIASLVIGIISILFGYIFLPLPIIGLVMGCSYKGKCSEKTAGVILNVIGLILSIISLILTIIFSILLVTAIVNSDVTDKIISGNIEVEDIGEWEEYSKYVIDSDILDHTITLTGNWKELSTDRSYLIIKDDEYIFFEDVNNMENNYQMGTYKRINNMSDLGIDRSFYGKFIDKFIGKIFENLDDQNFYLININPTKTVMYGEEVNREYEEDELIKSLYIKDEDGVVELTISGFEDGRVEHYYKVIE